MDHIALTAEYEKNFHTPYWMQTHNLEIADRILPSYDPLLL